MADQKKTKPKENAKEKPAVEPKAEATPEAKTETPAEAKADAPRITAEARARKRSLRLIKTTGTRSSVKKEALAVEGGS